MIKNFKEMMESAKGKDKKIISVACAQDEDVLIAVDKAYLEGIIDAILVGKKIEIEKIAKNIDMDLNNFTIIDIEDMTESAMKAVELVSSGKADMVMKGLVDTAILLKAVLNKEIGLRSGSILSHVAIFETAKYHKLFAVTDAAMNLAPDLMQKKMIIENTLAVTSALDIENPNVGVIAAKEKVNPKMQATVDAAELVRMNKDGELIACTVGGPFAIDNAISKDAAKIKGIKDPMAGDVDILLCPTIEAGNILYKTLNFLCESKSAGIIVGAKAPIILTSRADSEESKLYSIALAALMSN